MNAESTLTMPNSKSLVQNNAPGTVIFTGSRKLDKVQIHHLQFNRDELIEEQLDNYQTINSLPISENMIDWYDIRGLHDTELVEFIGKTLNLHPLVMEDVVDIHQRPKYEDFAGGFFLTLRALNFAVDRREMSTEHLAIYCGKGFVISFQEDETDLFQSVRKRILLPEARIRKRSADYLAYALADNIVDNYYNVMAEVDDLVEAMEDDIMEHTRENIKSEIHELRRQLQKARKTLMPLREAISRFSRSDNKLIDERTHVFVQDLFDHTIQINDTLESHRDTLNSLQDLYNSEVSFKMNQVMQVLTVVSTIFIPLTFLCGVYGMNFVNMPELANPDGYFYLWGIMIFLAIGCLLYFREKKWL